MTAEDLSLLAKLQDACLCLNDNTEYRTELLRSLPQIVVLGSQSVGKTTLLERLIGIDDVFPKGNGAMITRCPVLLQLSYDRKVEFSADMLIDVHRTTLRSPVELRQALEAYMFNIENWISDNVIRVKITSKKTPDLCLIDLPGLIRISNNDQPSDLDVRIRQLVKKFIINPSVLILAITSSTNDLANSDSLRFAKQIDPAGHRTIGVITKLDQIVDFQNIRQIISSTDKFPLKLGYVFLACGDKAAETPEAANVAPGLTESEYFELYRDAYRPVRSHCSITNLHQRLRSLLMQGIRKFAAERYDQLRAELNDVELQLMTLGSAPPSEGSSPGGTILTIVSKYCKAIDDLLEGKIDEHLPLFASPSNATNVLQSFQLPLVGMPENGGTGGTYECEEDRRVETTKDGGDELNDRRHDLVGGARLNFVFQDWFSRSLMRLDPLESIDDFEIRTAIRNSSGSSPSLFIPESVFESLVKKQIRRLENPLLQCVRQSVKELLAIFQFPISSCGRFSELQRYPQLQQMISKIVQSCVAQREEQTIRQTQHLIHIQTAYINKAHPDFLLDKEQIQKYFFHRVSAGASQPPPAGGSQPDHLSIATPPPSGPPDTYVMFEPHVPSTFMSFWRRHTVPGGLRSKPSHPNSSTPIPNESTSGQPFDPKTNCPPPLDHDSMIIEMVKMLIRSYFAIVKKSLADMLPKVIMYFLVNASREDVHQQLVMNLYKENVVESLLTESEEVVRVRHCLLDRQKLLQEACAILESLGGGR